MIYYSCHKGVLEMNKGDLGTYQKMLPEIFNSVCAAIGTHVMLIVLERSLWKTKIKYPEAAKIRFSEEGIFLDELETLESDKAEIIVNDFVLSIIDTLGRLIGIQVAEKLTEKLLAEPVKKGGE